jgi:hypothetical protein
VTIDIILNLLGLIISFGGLLAARLTKQLTLAIFACSLIVTTGVGTWLTVKHDREVSRVETDLSTRLSHNRWTLERIDSEMGHPDPKVLREALSRAIDHRTVRDQPTECIVNDGTVLSTRVYFNTESK